MWIRRILLTMGLLVLVCLAVVAFLISFWIVPVVVEGASMAPNFESGKKLIAYPSLTPNRWDPVVIRSPVDPRQLLLKRVIGLPGEKVAILKGDISINDQLISKRIEDQLRVRVLVAQAGYSAWGNQGKADWNYEANIWNYVSQDEKMGATLVFNHFVTDEHAANQTISRIVNFVDDLMLEFDLRLDDQAELRVEMPGVQLRLTAKEKIQIETASSQRVIKSPFQSNRFSKVFCSTFDKKFLLVGGGKVLATVPISAAESAWPRSFPISLTIAKGDASLRELSLWRDVYYEDLNKLDGNTWQLGENEWFVLGDNPPISLDSRNWEAPAALPTDAVVGVVY